VPFVAACVHTWATRQRRQRRTLCICDAACRAHKCWSRRTLCIRCAACRARKCCPPPPHSLHRLRTLPCSQMLAAAALFTDPLRTILAVLANAGAAALFASAALPAVHANAGATALFASVARSLPCSHFLLAGMPLACCHVCRYPPSRLAVACAHNAAPLFGPRARFR